MSTTETFTFDIPCTCTCIYFFTAHNYLVVDSGSTCITTETFPFNIIYHALLYCTQLFSTEYLSTVGTTTCLASIKVYTSPELMIRSYSMDIIVPILTQAYCNAVSALHHQVFPHFFTHTRSNVARIAQGISQSKHGNVCVGPNSRPVLFSGSALYAGEVVYFIHYLTPALPNYTT